MLLLVSPTASSDPVAEGTVDLGVIGRLYPVSEKDLLQEIRGRLAELRRSGRLALLARRARVNARAWAATPPGNALPSVTHPALRGAALVPPAAARASRRRLLFIDGTSTAQLRYAERQLQHYREQLKLVLVSGSPLTFRLQGLPAYFDQHGALARRIGIERVPSVVYTRDGRLLIEEVVTDE